MKKRYTDILFDLDNTLYDTSRLASESTTNPHTNVCVPGAERVVAYLEQCGYRLHVCTNGQRSEQEYKLRATGLANHFITLITSDEIGVEKPDSRFFAEALRMVGSNPTNTLVIGDNFDTDMLGAIHSGIDCMLFNRWQHDFVPPEPVTYIIQELTDIVRLL